MSIAKSTVQHPVLILMIFVLLAIIGVMTMGNIAIDLYPDVDFPYIVVTTEYDNAGPESVEKSVTKILESGLVSVSGLKQMKSISSEGQSRVMMEFEYGTDLDVANNEIRDKIDRVKRYLPDEADSPNIFKIDANSRPIMRIAVRGNRSADDLRQIADDFIVDRMEQTVGVAQASISGGREQIVRVEVSQNRLDAYNQTLTGVAQSISAQNLELGGGKITDSSRNYLIRTTGEYANVDEVSNTVVGVKNSYPVKVSDLGTAFLGYEDEDTAVYINGEPGVYISITKQSGTNSVAVADAVYKKMQEVQETLPADVRLELISD
ncbi:MAG: efflux RND transporter permease subunit, partial [Treponemataceae bacterium]